VYIYGSGQPYTCAKMHFVRNEQSACAAACPACAGWCSSLFDVGHMCEEALCAQKIGLARTIYVRCIYGIFGREIT